MPRKFACAPMGSCNGTTPLPKRFFNDASVLSKLACSLSILLMNDDARQRARFRHAPVALGLHFHAGHGIDDDQRGISHMQRHRPLRR